ncbi:C-C chemokine receptor type 6 isoform X12 [Rhinatrema bivittatum]|uniref:C-C chemokine receptor type 6 isoform X12 n=1 Tax=Rhinatrema bivittatum TaxID=194408 RepID=UPI0011264E1A|nr:C-C chemokine receptor type 6 isoform X12 [Rhinatrema bivittatum]XP_029450101.1 C-C chemokine receptor type 6 isoform X12 [Rhinatrema bivittatum]XP_029450102.1 C-C chemokine receptor type 6 isoform X12 [Rhinatrema bivittatum]XP_029450103.1 C-C chemokine receptor type 6 isoform X12 [Rhinatrema bivittatum]XP_029450104.1 C-C chemokine receptor type 6 isoform X12 [Rhinatrema bivittatum]XP_029450105.1 C-C chemokine receptor type 6 isoform X12 [Rhinatrema bivittatum]
MLNHTESANYVSWNTLSSTEYDEDYDSSELAIQCNKKDVRNFTKIFLPVAYSLIGVLGLIGNILVVVTFTFYKRAKSMTDVYLLNMAIADILFVTTLPFWAVSHADSWIFKDFMCKLVKGIYAINFNCSMLLLTCISIDRYIAIVQATRSFRFRATTLTHKTAICLVVWTVSILISSITFIFSASYEHHNVDEHKTICEPRYNVGTSPNIWKLTTLGLQVLFGFLFPVLVMCFCYSFIIRTLLETHNSQRHKAIRVVIAVMVVFLVCQVPYNMVVLVHALGFFNKEKSCLEEKQTAYAMFITEALAFLHCCLNPVLYAFIGIKFRNYFLKIIQDLWCLSKKYITVNHTSRFSSDVYPSRRTSEVCDTDNGSSFTV